MPTGWFKSLLHSGQGNSKESTKRQKEAWNDTTAISPTSQWALLGDAAQAKREHLWDEAYDNLRLDLPELVTKYEEILSLDIEAMATESPVQGSSRTELMKTSISQTDLKVRWHQMWTMCESQRAASRLVHWLGLIVSGDTDVFLQGEQILRERVVDLYSEILSYLMNAVLPTGCQFDTWESSLARLKEAESNLLTFSGGLMVQQLDGFLMLARENENRRILPKTKETMRLRSEIDDKLARLGGFDAASGLIESHNENGQLADELSQWISSTEQYKSVIYWNTKDISENDSNENITGSIMSQILLIGSGPGLNKTAFMEAIVRQLLNKANVEESDILKDDPKSIPCHRRDDSDDLGDLIRLIKATRDVPHKIRWLLSADTKVCIELELMKRESLQYLSLEEAYQAYKLAGIFHRKIISMVDQLANQRRYPEQTKREVVKIISDRSQENALWAVIACANLRKEENWNAVEALKEMPERLDEFAPPPSGIGTVQSGIVKFIDSTARQNTWRELHQDLDKFSEAHSLITRKSLEFLSAHFETVTLHVPELNRDALTSDCLHIDAAVLMKKLESVLLEQARDEKRELMNTQDFKQPTREISNRLGENEQNHILALVRDGIQIIRSYISSSSIFSTNPNSLLFYPDESTLKQDWIAKNKSWLVMPPKMAGSWGDISITLNQSRIRSIAFSPDGRLLASGLRGDTIRVWDAETGEAQLTLQTMKTEVHYVAFSPNGQLVSVSENGDFQVWDLSTGRSLKTWTVEGREIMAIRFSPNAEESEKLVLATSKALLLWSFSDFGKPTWTYTEEVLEEERHVYAVDFSQQGTWIASGGAGGDINIWDAHRGNACQRTLHGHKGDVNSVAFSRDEKRLVSGSDDLKVKIWSVETGANLKSFNCADIIREVAFSPDDSLITAGSGNEVKVWESESGRQRCVMRGHDEPVISVAFSPQGRLASGSADWTIRLWSLEGIVSNGMSAIREPVKDHPIRRIAMSPDGKYLASASGQSIRLWDGLTGMPMKTHELFQAGVLSISFSPDGTRLVTSSRDETVKVWDVASGNVYRTFHGHSDWVTFATFSPDGTSIASASEDHTVKIWSCLPEAKEEDIIVLQGHSGCVGDGKVWVWDSATGDLIQGPLQTKAPTRTVGFDRNIPEYILTEVGADLSAFESSPFLVEEGQKGGRYGVAPGSDWITWNGRNIIPIPEVYLPTASWVQGNIVAIGTEFGKKPKRNKNPINKRPPPIEYYPTFISSIIIITTHFQDTMSLRTLHCRQL
ncbi:quinon protein alcohol dehydrogenase-like superfamily [Trichoderma sp. SZMC 28013]